MQNFDEFLTMTNVKCPISMYKLFRALQNNGWIETIISIYEVETKYIWVKLQLHANEEKVIQWKRGQKTVILSFYLPFPIAIANRFRA